VGTRVVASRRDACEASMRHGTGTPQAWRTWLHEDGIQIQGRVVATHRSTGAVPAQEHGERGYCPDPPRPLTLPQGAARSTSVLSAPVSTAPFPVAPSEPSDEFLSSGPHRRLALQPASPRPAPACRWSSDSGITLTTSLRARSLVVDLRAEGPPGFPESVPGGDSRQSGRPYRES